MAGGSGFKRRWGPVLAGSFSPENPTVFGLVFKASGQVYFTTFRLKWSRYYTASPEPAQEKPAGEKNLNAGGKNLFRAT